MSVSVYEHLRLTSGEHDRFKHFVLAVDLRNSLLWGTKVEALCGKKWRPDGNPDRYPMCPTCVSINSAHQDEDEA